METWRISPSFPEVEVSDLGRVRRRTATKFSSPGRVLAQQTRPDGYVLVGVQKAPRYVHRLVCEAFHGPAPIGRECVAHFDGSRSNNTPANLRWVSYAENEADKLRHGTTARGSRSGTAKLTEAQVTAIRAAYRLGIATQADLSRAFGVVQTKISEIVNHKTWRHVE